jgi:hypothetical protein
MPTTPPQPIVCHEEEAEDEDFVLSSQNTKIIEERVIDPQDF